MPHQIKLEANDLFSIIENLKPKYSTEEHDKNPLYILAHNEIIKYSKEELEACIHPTKKNRDLFKTALESQNPFIFSSILKKKAFQNKLTEESRWLLKALKKPTDEIYNLIYFIEDDKIRNNRGLVGESNEQRNERKKDILFYFILDYSNSKNLELIEKYYQSFGKKKPNNIIKHIITNYNKNSNVYDYLLIKLKNDNIDINVNNYMNNFLPTENENHFYIKSFELPLIKNLLKLGFRFNEKDYSHKGNNLFMALLKYEGEYTTETLLPYLHDIIPENEKALETQNDFIKNLKDTPFNKKIKTTYLNLLLESKLTNKIKDNETKIKI